jgi:hypothetical protein
MNPSLNYKVERIAVRLDGFFVTLQMVLQECEYW